MRVITPSGSLRCSPQTAANEDYSASPPCARPIGQSEASLRLVEVWDSKSNCVCDNLWICDFREKNVYNEQLSSVKNVVFLGVSINVTVGDGRTCACRQWLCKSWSMDVSRTWSLVVDIVICLYIYYWYVTVYRNKVLI